MTTDTPRPAARRGRPPRSAGQAEASRQRIVKAARDLFAAEGYRGVSMRKVAARAACQPSTLYALFPGKRQLLHFLWEGIFTDLSAALARAWNDHAAPDRLAALCLATIDFWLGRPDDFMAVFLVEDHPREPGDQYFAQSSPALLNLTAYRRAVTEAQERGEVRAGDPDDIKNALVCCLQGVAYNLICIPEYPWGDPAEIKRIAVQTLVGGLR